MQEFGFMKFSPENIYLKVCSASFHRAQSASFLIWFPFRVCWRSATALANDSTLVEADGKWCSFVGSFTWAGSDDFSEVVLPSFTWKGQACIKILHLLFSLKWNILSPGLLPGCLFSSFQSQLGYHQFWEATSLKQVSTYILLHYPVSVYSPHILITEIILLTWLSEFTK